jgi:hypothetical protein
MPMSPRVSTRGGGPPSITCGFHVKHPAGPSVRNLRSLVQHAGEQVELRTGRDPRKEVAADRPQTEAVDGRNHLGPVETAPPRSAATVSRETSLGGSRRPSLRALTVTHRRQSDVKYRQSDVK